MWTFGLAGPWRERAENDMATKYPQYTIGQWLDTSEESMSKPQATILYGVQIKPAKGAKWMHVTRSNEPQIFDTIDKASAAIAELKAADAAGA